MSKLLTIAMAATAVLLAACHTVQGVGRDLQSAGNAMEKAGN